jgi:signal transduction histidine kinase
MRQPHYADQGSAAEPRILPLPAVAGVAVRDLVESVLAGHAARTPAASAVTVTVDVPAAAVLGGDPAPFRVVVERLVASAFAAASAPRPHGEGPILREVVITAVQGADALELEIADSGPSSSADDRCPAHVRELVARCGGSLHVAACAEGGIAVTVRVPRREARRQAA